MPTPGTRVGTVFFQDAENIHIFGYGVYVGDEVPSEECAGMGRALREHGIKNPTIKLDNGKTVYGCECWWGPEDVIKQRVIASGRNVVEADIDAVRIQANAEAQAQEQN